MPRRFGSGYLPPLRPPTDPADAAVRAELIERSVRLRGVVRELLALDGPDADLSELEALLTSQIDGSVS